MTAIDMADAEKMAIRPTIEQNAATALIASAVNKVHIANII